jgi:N-methylhydantoinase B
MKKRIDPITLEVIRNALYSVSDEMSAALIRTAYSTNIKDRRDCSCAIYLTTGEVVAQSEIGTPLHLGVMPAVVQTVLKRFPPERMDPGDDIIVNEPYPAGPGHLNDVTCLPVFTRKAIACSESGPSCRCRRICPWEHALGVTEIFQKASRSSVDCEEDVIDEEIAGLISTMSNQDRIQGISGPGGSTVWERRFWNSE